MHVRGIDATYYTVADINGVSTFYSKILGEPTTTWEGRLVEWELADHNAFGLYGTPAKPSHRSGSVMFAVDDLDATIRDLRENGIRLEGDGAISEGEHCRMAFGQDPEGNQFILHQRR